MKVNEIVSMVMTSGKAVADRTNQSNARVVLCLTRPGLAQVQVQGTEAGVFGQHMNPETLRRTAKLFKKLADAMEAPPRRPTA